MGSADLRAAEDGRARVTHPFHPLFDQVFEVVDRRRLVCGERLYLEVEPGRVESVPVGWTSQAVADPFVTMAAGRSLFHVDDLVRLGDLVAQLKT